MKSKLTLRRGCVVLLLSVACQNAGQPVSLRSQTRGLNEAQVLQIIEERGFALPASKVRGTFAQRYQSVVLTGVRVVNELTTGLMWQGTESPRVTWNELQVYRDETNLARHAGFSDWRIPTIEELASLLEARRAGTFYLDEVFEKDDVLITWTTDESPDAVGGAWFVNFSDGSVLVGNRLAGLGHGRLVRTMSPRP